MKKILLVSLLGAVGLAFAAQNSTPTLRQVRDPVQLRSYLTANAADAESRIAVVESGVTVTNYADAFSTATNNIALLQAKTAYNFYVVNTTQLVYIASGVTNVIDADITH